MASAISPQLEIIHAYRHLLRAGLRAVQFSKPSRYVFRDRLHEAFCDRKATYEANFDQERIRRTIWFLNAAAQEAGLEARILKNLLRVAWERANVGCATYKMALQKFKQNEANNERRVKEGRRPKQLKP